jgi:hypothetical protein
MKSSVREISSLVKLLRINIIHQEGYINFQSISAGKTTIFGILRRHDRQSIQDSAPQETCMRNGLLWNIEFADQ